MSQQDVPVEPKSGPEKLEAVTALMSELRADLDQRTLSAERRKEICDLLKVYGRETPDADPIYSEDGLKTLCKQAFHPDTATDAAREALSCVANAMLLKADMRTAFAALGLWAPAIERLKRPENREEFLICRILFLVTYDRTLDFDDIVNEHQLAPILNDKIARHAALLADATPRRRQWDDNALVEICQLIFNICQFYPSLAVSFNVSVANLFFILKKSPGDPPLKQPVAAAINTLLNSDFFSDTWKNGAFPEPDPTVNVSMLISILTATLEQYPDGPLNKLALPLTALIHKMYSVGPPQVKELVKQKLLPSDADRAQVLGRGTSFSSRLLRLSNAPSTPNLGESISILLYALSDNDPEKFVYNVGLGYGAGYLMNHGIPLPAAPKETTDASGANINPITGQRRDAEVEDTLPPMTDEEKEQEAEKLFVLFERLNKTGVMKVKNPVQEAVDSGRFKELPD